LAARLGVPLERIRLYYTGARPASELCLGVALTSPVAPVSA
jgi:hypothetical protein